MTAGMSEPRPPLRRIVVAGAGQLGALAAIALRRTLPRSEVLVVGTPPDPAAFADRAPTALPFTNRLHDRFGIAEERLVREAGASHRLVARYRGWGGDGHEGVAPYGATVDPRLKTRFARDWGGGPRNASTGAPPASLGEVLAAEGRFQPPSVEPGSPLADLDYALRWNPAAYRDLLVREAQKLGVQYLHGSVTTIALREGGGLDAIGIDGGEPLVADLYLDCTGPRAALLSELPESRWRSWQPSLPIRGVQYGRPGAPVLGLEDRISLTPVGWRAELAGRDGAHVALAMVEGTTEQDARAALGADFADFVPFEPGRTEQAWIGNVVALGDAAATFEPLAWLNLDLAHRQLALLLDLLPGQDPDPRERAEFNRRAGSMADRVRDVLGAHYAAPAAAHLAVTPAGPLERSPELGLMLDQYWRRGRMPFFEEMPLAGQECSALLDALGHPAGIGALTLAADPREGAAEHRAFAAKANAALHAVPPYGVWMRQVLER